MTLNEELEHVAREIKDAERRRAEIYKRSIDAPEAEKVCADWMSKMILEHEPSPAAKHGWVVDDIVWKDAEMLKPSWRTRGSVGPVFVSVRPCDKRFGGKTYLGVLLGDFPVSLSCAYGPATRVLEIEPAMHNPCIYIPDMGEVVFGCGSWWGVIDSPDKLREITVADIDSVWYVRALRSFGVEHRKDE
jgi:hypothetical protein